MRLDADRDEFADSPHRGMPFRPEFKGKTDLALIAHF
jgi:hypothetical protein